MARRPAPTARAGPGRRGARWGWAWVALSALAIAVYAPVPYLTGPLAESGGSLASAYAGQPAFVRVAFYLHIVCGGLALLLGPWQFARRLRERHPAVHRATGWATTVCVLAASAAALVLAPVNTAGMVGFFGFGTLAVLWPLATLRAVRAARARDFAGHQAWMMRSFALTYAAVTLRVSLIVLIFAQLPFLSGADAGQAAQQNAYAAVPFLCWLPNIVVAEWLIRRRGLPSFRVQRQEEAAHAR
ncbi:MAG TPA: DUF2306 domain-containing protein [Streptosporangiaceae bacterium]